MLNSIIITIFVAVSLQPLNLSDIKLLPIVSEIEFSGYQGDDGFFIYSMIGIYKITNLVNGKFYVGSSKELPKRKWRHFKDLENNTHGNVHLQRAYNKYGKDNFEFFVIENCTQENILEREQYYLDELKPQYNIGKQAKGGDNLTNHPNKRKIIATMTKSVKKRYKNRTEEDKKKRSEALKGELNPNWKGGIDKFICPICGTKVGKQAKIQKTCSACKNRSGKDNPFYGKKHSKKTKKLLSEKAKLKGYVGKQNKPFLINDKRYESLGEAFKELNIPTVTIWWRLKSNNTLFINYKYV